MSISGFFNRRVPTLLLPLLVVGCAAPTGPGQSGVGGGGGLLAPRIISANERSVSVEIMILHNEADALRVADAHCKKFGRSAVLAQDRGRGKFNYQCVQ